MHMYMALISFVAADWKKLQFFKFQKKKKIFQTREWVYNASYFFSKFWSIGQISQYNFYHCPQSEFQIKDCHVIPTPQIQLPCFMHT